MRQTFIRWLYRILTPRHPRGWLEMHAVAEGEKHPATVWVHCHGMERWKLPNVEIVGVPADLAGYAHAILFDLTGYMKLTRPIYPDESFGGLLVSEGQRAHHKMTLRQVHRYDDPAHSGMLRVVDFGRPADAGFPFQLFAVHLCAVAEGTRSPAARQATYRRAIALEPGDPAAAAAEGEPEPGGNENNFLAWEGLAEALCDLGRFDQGILCLEEAVARCPRWARQFAEHVRREFAGKESEQTDPRFTFWSRLDLEEVRARVIERRKRPGPSSAGKGRHDPGSP